MSNDLMHLQEPSNARIPGSKPGSQESQEEPTEKSSTPFDLGPRFVLRETPDPTKPTVAELMN